MRATNPAARVALLTVALLLAACEATAPSEPAADPNAAPTVGPSASRNGVSQRRELDARVWNACTGEDLQLTGTITRVARFHEDEGGGYHWMANYVIQGRAVGVTTGTEYVYHETHNMKENGAQPFHGILDAEGPYYFTMSFIATMITPGSAPNELWQWDWRYRVDESGGIVTDEFRFECLTRG